jgi:hypothetical protein
MPETVTVIVDEITQDVTVFVEPAPVEEVAVFVEERLGRDGVDGEGLTPIATVPRGEAISAARAVYLASDGGTIKAYLATATDASKAAVGFVKEAGSLGESVEVWDSGPITGLSGIVASAPYFLGAAGQFVTAPPSGAALVQRIGTGVSASAIAGRIEPAVTVV